MTQKAFLSTVSNPALARAVIRQMGGWRAFSESARDVANHGADAGFSGFIYYRDTCKFTARNRSLIRESVGQMASDLGESAVTMVKGFRCLNNDFSEDEVGQCLYGRGSKGDAGDMIDNALAWYALEEVSRAYDDFANDAD